MRIHIGEKIKARAKELRMGPTELAQHISTSKQNVYGIYKRESIDTELLQKISKALELDFFCYYFDPKLPIAEEDLPKYFARNRQKADPAAEEVILLRKELAELREKFDILKKLYELTTEKKPVKDYPTAKTAGKKKK